MFFILLEIIDYKLLKFTQYGVYQCELFLRIINRRSLSWTMFIGALYIDLLVMTAMSYAAFHKLIPNGLFTLVILFGVFLLWYLNRLRFFLATEHLTKLSNKRKEVMFKKHRLVGLYCALVLIMTVFLSHIFESVENPLRAKYSELAFSFLYVNFITLTGYYFLSTKSVDTEKLAKREERKKQEGAK